MQIELAPRPAPDARIIAHPVAKDGLDAVLARTGGQAALVRAIAADGRFDGGAGSVIEAHLPTAAGGDQGGDGAEAAITRHLFFGIGAGTPADVERGAGALVGRLLTSGATELTIDADGLDEAAGEALALAAALRSWRIDTYRTRLPETQKPTLGKVTIAGATLSSTAAERAAALAAGVALTRELVSEPANIIYPESFVERCRHLGELGVEIEVLGPEEMAALGMGALLGVAQGSVREARLLIMRWNGLAGGDTGGDDAGEPPLVLIGKGVTFDTGGISLKPGAGMDMMKWDMGGAGAVAGAMKAIAGRKAKAHVVGLCGLVENMPDGNAQRPGDIVTTMSGQTVEVLNTDAEGRLVLADVVTYAQQTFKPRTIVDLATLTGAMVISLGGEYAGIFSNDEALASDLIAAGEATGDRLWRFPLGEGYDKLIDSPIADIKNIGPREAGSITAAQFIKRFVDEGVAWAHLDVAGVVWADKDGATYAKGATGYGVRLLDRFVQLSCEQPRAAAAGASAGA